MTIDFQARIEKAKASALASAAALTDEMRAEIAFRAEESAWIERDAIDAKLKRDLDIAHREEAAREALGEKAKIGLVVIDDYPDSFILTHKPDAFKLWESTLNSGKKFDRLAVNLRFAVAAIHDWNGITDWNTPMPNYLGKQSSAGVELGAYLTANPGMITPITNEAARLAGLFKEERKRGG